MAEADEVRVERRAGAEPDERGPGSTTVAVAAAAVIVAVAGASGVLAGAGTWLVVLPVLAVVAVAVVASLASSRATREHAGRVLAERRVAGLQGELQEANDARESAEARLVWRNRLAGLRRSAEADTLADPDTGLLSEGWFAVAVESRIAAARRNLTPVAVVMFEVVQGLGEGLPVPSDPVRVAEAVKRTLRESDGAFRLHDGGFAMLLDDTSDMGALWTTERVRNALAAVEPGAVLWAGVACYPAHGLTSDAILERADQALDNARQWRQDRIEVAPADA